MKLSVLFVLLAFSFSGDMLSYNPAVRNRYDKQARLKKFLQGAVVFAGAGVVLARHGEDVANGAAQVGGLVLRAGGAGVKIVKKRPLVAVAAVAAVVHPRLA